MSGSQERILIAGIDLGGTHMQVGIVDDGGEIVGRSQGFTDQAGGVSGVCAAMAAKVREACDAAGVGVAELRGIGLAAPGAVDPGRRVVINAPNLGWFDASPADELERLLGGVPVALDNDVNAAALAEHELGAGRGGGDLLAVWIGTGVGGGLILNGAVYHGPGFTAGEIGHVAIAAEEPGGPATEIEQVASRTAIARAVAMRIERGEGSQLADAVRSGERLTSHHLTDAFEAGDPVVVEVVTNAMERLGFSLAGIVTLLSIRRIVLGGGLIEVMGERLCPMVQAAVRQHAWPESAKAVEVQPTALGPDAGLLGAAMLARGRVLR